MQPQGTVGTVGFCVADTAYGRLCNALARFPEVRFTRRGRFFVFAGNVRAEFMFQGLLFRVQPDPWDGAWWVVPRGEGDYLAALCALHEMLFGSAESSLAVCASVERR